jgi:hypothetical protein
MGDNSKPACVTSEKVFKKQAKTIFKLAKKQGLIAITNRVTLFIDGKPCRRWWFADKESHVLLSVEYGLIDQEAIVFLTNKI